ncbi:hypothetical protein R1sor_021987 [Riccia sorocarpa]|uniref:Uncharacterized protein n=1 Tax=Riccia sorocarpa TaxID=122646 RepID=A0ABD3GMD6_9MARC
MPHMTEPLKRSFETHCYNEHCAGFQVCPFDENSNELVVTDEDKAKWDVLWRMESEKFDEESSKVAEYQNLVNRKSSHATVQYDWIQDAERCLQVLSTPLNAYKDMIEDDVYDEFEKSRMKTPVNRPWYNENMTSMAAAYILSFAEVTAAKEAHRTTEDAKVKDLCNTWYNAIFMYATIVSPQLGPEFLATVRELHNTLAKTEKNKAADHL